VAGVYLCRYDKVNGKYVEISSGNFSNPVIFDFTISGSGEVLEKVEEYYILIRDTVVNKIYLRMSGYHSHIKIEFSLDKENWSEDLLINRYINAVNSEVVIPIYIKVSITDEFGVFPLNQITNFNDFKIILTYT